MINIKYVGSKARIAKDIVPIIQKCIDDTQIKNYYEPFCGGCNLIEHIKCETRYANDIHKELIALFKALQSGFTPPMHISENEYNRVRLNKQDYPDYYVGLVGFNATFGSKYFGGYARGYKADGITPRDIPNEAIRNLMAQVPKLTDIIFSCGDYRDVDIIEPAVIYCDKPYDAPTKYAVAEFDHVAFWEWVRHKSENNYVFVSEYNAPEDFICLWSKPITTSLKVKEHENRTEKLFTYKTGKYAEYLSDTNL